MFRIPFESAPGSEPEPDRPPSFHQMTLKSVYKSLQMTDRQTNRWSRKQRGTKTSKQMFSKCHVCASRALPLFMCHMFERSGSGFPIADLRDKQTDTLVAHKKCRQNHHSDPTFNVCLRIYNRSDKI